MPEATSEVHSAQEKHALLRPTVGKDRGATGRASTRFVWPSILSCFCIVCPLKLLLAAPTVRERISRHMPWIAVRQLSCQLLHLDLLLCSIDFNIHALLEYAPALLRSPHNCFFFPSLRNRSVPTSKSLSWRDGDKCIGHINVPMKSLGPNFVPYSQVPQNGFAEPISSVSQFFHSLVKGSTIES